MRLMTCRNARALASMMSVLTARPVMTRPLYSASTLGLALGVLADRHAADAVVAQLHLDAGDALDGLEHRVDRAVAEAGVAEDGAVLVPQADRRRRDRRRAGVAGDRLQRPHAPGRVWICASASASMSAS